MGEGVPKQIPVESGFVGTPTKISVRKKFVGTHTSFENVFSILKNSGVFSLRRFFRKYCRNYNQRRN